MSIEAVSRPRQSGNLIGSDYYDIDFMAHATVIIALCGKEIRSDGFPLFFCWLPPSAQLPPCEPPNP